MNMICPACDTTNRNGASFCLGCGARLAPAPPPPVQAPPAVPPVPAVPLFDELVGATTVRSRRCDRCGADNRAMDNFCKACGATIGLAVAQTMVMPIAAAAPSPPPSRSKLPIVAFAVVAALLVVGIGVVLLSGGDDEGEAISSTDRDNTEKTLAEDVDATIAATTTVVASDVQPTTVAPAQVSPTTAPPPPDTTAPPPPTVPPTLPPLPGDLGLSQPMTQPPCDGGYITVLASALNSATNATAVNDSLVRYLGSAYLKTAETCSSLRPSVDGEPIYVVYSGPFLTESEACSARSSGPADAYVRILSSTVPDSHRVDC